ncbi:MAG: heme lyase CcmF/NrfE family subunit [Deltaproteobacteria bacterium]
MIAELGHFALILALAVAAVQVVVPMIGAHKGWSAWMEQGRVAALLQVALIALAFVALTQAFMRSDFSLRVVADNSNQLQPMIYKIAGVWGNHEGSMLLWVLILAMFGAAVAVFGAGLPSDLRARVLGVQGLIGLAFLGFILFTSNPFERLAVPPFAGSDLNPLLQDPGLAFHPPFLYLGYVGLSVAFSFAIAALISGRVDAAWARWVRPWTLAAWSFLTIGIAMGSWWAYYELGWGGFWFWDPVENASLVPWLFATALVHSAVVVEKREALIGWTVLLAILAFGFSLIGTFLVRSGAITSVHAFASDPTRGVFILGILAAFLGGGLVLFALRADRMVSRAGFKLVSREGALVMNNLLLTTAAVVVFLGTVWPMVMEFGWGRAVSVGPPFYNLAVTPFVVALFVILPVGSILPWKRGDLGKASSRMFAPYLLALAVAGLGFAVASGGSILTPLGLGLGGWLIFGAARDLWLRAGRWARLKALSGADWGRAFAHGGLGVTLIGIAASLGLSSELLTTMKPGDLAQIGGYEVQLQRVERVQGPNYLSDMATLDVRKNGASVAVLKPERRFYPVAGMPTTEAAIRTRLTGDIYLVVGEPQGDGSYAMRFYTKPLAVWIWFGALMMALGGAFSLFDRRLRMGAPVARTKTVAAE